MQMMVEEWSDMEFSIEPYGETGTYTLSSVDSIQVQKKLLTKIFFCYGNVKKMCVCGCGCVCVLCVLFFFKKNEM
jgi:hypothetical protein